MYVTLRHAQLIREKLQEMNQPQLKHKLPRWSASHCILYCLSNDLMQSWTKAGLLTRFAVYRGSLLLQ